MNYLNLPVSVFHSPEYIGSAPLDRATWLNLMAHCAEQENGGTLAACGQWKDRQWQQIAGVTLEEVHRPCALWQWSDDADSIAISFYPTQLQAELEAKREGGRQGGFKKAQNLNKQRGVVAELVGQPVGQPVAVPLAQLLGKEGRKEGSNVREGKEGALSQPSTDASSSASSIPTWEEFLAYIRKVNPDIPEIYCKDKFLAQSSASPPWGKIGNWFAYADRIIGWWVKEGMPGGKEAKAGNGSGKMNQIGLEKLLVRTEERIEELDDKLRYQDDREKHPELVKERAKLKTLVPDIERRLRDLALS